MATESDGWLERLKARVEDALASGNRRLDEMEAERERERADKPWLSDEGETPTLDQVRARIEWEEGRAARRGGDATGEDADPGSGTKADARPPTGSAGSGAIDPDAAEREAMRIEMAERERASKARLEQIRRELGVDPADTTGDGAGDAPGAT